jgi:glycosyltransferase involved in cell wall biosynthesis
VVVDDGSKTPVPEAIHRWEKVYSLKIVKQCHGGVARARNRGIQESQGEILLFVDADCKLQANCLWVLDEAIARSPQHDCFQLRLTGDCSRLVGRAEELRLQTLQTHMLQSDGRIRYLNTAGCAMRRTSVDAQGQTFEPSALRYEDTLFLANMIEAGKLPVYVPGAVVQHAIPLSLATFFLKEIRSAYLQGRASDLLAAKRVKLRASHRERLEMAASMWNASGQKSIGRLAWFVVIFRQLMARSFSLIYRLLRIRPGSHTPEHSL